MRRLERGSVAIEFAIVFPLFLLILYGIISYAICFAVMITLHGLSGDAARAVVGVERSSLSLESESVQQDIAAAIEDVLESSWLDSSLIQGCEEDNAVYGIQEDGLNVCLRVHIGADADPGLALPRLGLLGIDIPHLDQVHSSSSIRL